MTSVKHHEPRYWLFLVCRLLHGTQSETSSRGGQDARSSKVWNTAGASSPKCLRHPTVAAHNCRTASPFFSDRWDASKGDTGIKPGPGSAYHTPDNGKSLAAGNFPNSGSSPCPHLL